MKTFNIKTGNLLFTITYDEASGSSAVMSAAGLSREITRDFAEALECLSPESRTDLFDTVFSCKRALKKLATRIDEREQGKLDISTLVGGLLTKVIH